MVKFTSVRPLMRTRLGTDAEIETDPVEVEPRPPCVEAFAVPAPDKASIPAAQAPVSMRCAIVFISVCPQSPVIHPERMYLLADYAIGINGSSTPFI